MEDNVADNPFAGSREMAEAGAGFIAYLNDRFPNAQALVDAIEDILSELCLNLTNLTDAFNTGSPEFEEKHGEHILVIKRYQVLSEPDWLKNYLSPTLFPYLLSLWKDEHTNEEAKLCKLLARVRGYEAAWHKFAQSLLNASRGSVHAFELIQKATTLCYLLSLTFSAKGLSSYYADYLRTEKEVRTILRQIAAELATKDLSEEAKAKTESIEDDIETYAPSARPRYTQQLAAKLIGVTAATIANWENGRVQPPPGYSKALRRCKGNELIEFAESYRARIHNEALASPKANLKKP